MACGSLSLLPGHILPVMAEWLAPRDLLVCCSVSRIFRNLCDVPWVWQALCRRLHPLGAGLCAASVQEWQQHCRALLSLPRTLQRAPHEGQVAMAEEGGLLRVTTVGDSDMCFQADCPVEAGGAALFYFEIHLDHLTEDGAVALGFTPEGYPAFCEQPGWKMGSYGWHGDDARMFHHSSFGVPVPGQQPWEQNEVIGCGIRGQGKRSIFYTRNGRFVEDFWVLPGDAVALYPSIGMDERGQAIRVNFGQRPFVFDVAQLRTQEDCRGGVLPHVVDSDSESDDDVFGFYQNMSEDSSSSDEGNDSDDDEGDEEEEDHEEEPEEAAEPPPPHVQGNGVGG